MSGTGLDSILNSAFNGIGNMLDGKAWTEALRGLRMAMTAIMSRIVVDEGTSVSKLFDA